MIEENCRTSPSSGKTESANPSGNFHLQICLWTLTLERKRKKPKSKEKGKATEERDITNERCKSKEKKGKEKITFENDGDDRKGD